MKLVVLLNHFPFGSGEEFFENELPYLADKFEHIIIYSEGSGEQTRSVPNHVKIVHGKLPSPLRLVYFLFLSGINMFSKDAREEYTIIKKNYKKGITVHKLIRILWFFFREQITKSYLDRLEISGEDTILYAYWLHTPAFSIARSYPGVKKFSRAHGYDLHAFRQKEDYLPFRKLLYSNLDYIFFVSSKGRDYYQQRYEKEFIIDKRKLLLSKLGVEEHPVNRVEEDSGFFTLVSCSSIIELKRLDLMIDALSHLENEKVKWIHIGEGNDSEKIKLRAKEKLDLKANIDYEFAGSLTNQEVISFYTKHHIDLFINMSNSEAVPVSIMEAMSFGIPVIARDIGGISEIVNGKNGKLISENPLISEITDELKKFVDLKEKGKLLDYQKEAKMTWREEYSAQKNYSDFVEILLKKIVG